MLAVRPDVSAWIGEHCTKTQRAPMRISADFIVAYTAAWWAYDVATLVNGPRATAFARHVAMFLCRKLGDASYPTIARWFGRRDHTTAMYAVAKIGKLLEKDADFRADLDSLEEEITKSHAAYLEETLSSAPGVVHPRRPLEVIPGARRPLSAVTLTSGHYGHAE